jgi:hypothetical protein
MSRGRPRRTPSADQRPGKVAWPAVGILSMALTVLWMATHKSDVDTWVADMKVHCQARYARANTARDTASVDLTWPE